MADRPGGSLPALPRPARPQSGLASADSSYSLHRRVQPHAPANSDAQLLALAVTLAALLILAGVTLTVGFVALVVIGLLLLIISPLLLITSPLWAPLALVAIVAVAALLFGSGLAVFALGAGTWAHRYLMGRHPVGYAYDIRGRGRFAGAASHYGRGYGRRKDAAPEA